MVRASRERLGFRRTAKPTRRLFAHAGMALALSMLVACSTGSRTPPLSSMVGAPRSADASTSGPTLPETSAPETSAPEASTPAPAPTTPASISVTPPTAVPPSVPTSGPTSVPTSAASYTRTSTTASSTPTAARTGVPTVAPTHIPLPDVRLAGVNDPACRSGRPPVVLLHGTFSTPASNFTPMAARLRASGRCVFAVLYGAAFGWGGIGDIDSSARQVARFIEHVRLASGAAKVDVVAFSQGALVLRDALQGGLDPAAVGTAVFVAPNYHGTTVPLVTKVPAFACPACAEQTAGSALLTRLEAGGELAGDIRYATLSSSHDEWVQPVSGQSPRGPATRVRTAWLQDICPSLTIRHMDLPFAAPVINWTVAALDSDGRPPSTGRCS